MIVEYIYIYIILYLIGYCKKSSSIDQQRYLKTRRPSSSTMSCFHHILPVELLDSILNFYSYEHVPLWRHVCSDWNNVWITHTQQQRQKHWRAPEQCHCSFDNVRCDDKHAINSASTTAGNKPWCCCCCLFDSNVVSDYDETDRRCVFSIVPRLQVRPPKNTKLSTVEKCLKQKCIREVCIPIGSLRLLAYHGHLNALQWIYSLRSVRCLRPWKRSGIMLELACIAAYYGHSNIVDAWLTLWNTAPLALMSEKEPLMMTNHPLHVQLVTECAARGGRADIIEYCAKRFEKEPVDYEQPAELLKQAARGGHMDLFKHIVRRSALLNNPICSYDLNIAMCAAARAGHVNLVRLCIETHACSNVDNALVRAARGGHVDLVKLLVMSYSAKAFNMAMAAAARGGYFDLMCYFHDTCGADDVNLAFAYAASGGQESLLRFCHDTWNADAVEYAMRLAAAYGRASIVQICHEEWGARNVAEALEEATIGGHVDVVRMCREKWVAHWSNARGGLAAIPLAAQFSHFQLVQLFSDKYKLLGLETGMLLAANVGNKQMVQSIHQQYPLVPIQAALLSAAGNGKLSIVKWLLFAVKTQSVNEYRLTCDSAVDSMSNPIATSLLLTHYVDQIVFVSRTRQQLRVLNWSLNEFQVNDADAAYNRGRQSLIKQCMREYAIADEDYALAFMHTCLRYGGTGFFFLM